MSRSRPRNDGGTVASIHRRDRKCWLCGRGVAKVDASRDHVNPQSSGGYDKARNYRLAHRVCNTARGNLPESAAEAVLVEMEPGASTDLICQALRRAQGDWNRELARMSRGFTGRYAR